MAVLKRIGVTSLAKIYGAAGVIVGLVLGVIIAAVGTALGAVKGAVGFGAAFGVLAIIILPIVYGVVMFVLGAVSAFLYNIIAERIGGVELEFDQRKSKS